MKKLLIVGAVMVSVQLHAQRSFTVEEAVTYGISHHSDVKNALVKRQDTEMEIKEIKLTGMPKVNGQFQYTYNAIVPTQLVQASNFNPEAGPDEVVKFKFGVPWGGQAGIGVNQLIYDATWLVGLRAADTYRQLADQGIKQSKTTIAENVTKAYYSVLVAEERIKLLDLNIARIDSMELNVSEMYKQGFVEKIDLDRLAVQKNNLKAEKAKVANLIELSYQLLKFQMAYDINESISLKNTLAELESQALSSQLYAEVNPEDRIELQLLNTNRKLIELNAERYAKSVYPSVFFSGSLGAGHSNPKFNPFERWFGSSALNIGLNIPIYDSGLRKIQIERQRLNMIQIDNTAEMLKNSFKLQNQQAAISLKNGIENLDIQKRNLELAEEIIRVSKIKYEQGLGTNLEVINAENDYRQAQTNYFAALYDLLVAKVDMEKAQGKLITE